MILDARRNNPFISRMVMNRVSTRAVARGLSAVEPAHGEVVFYTAARDGSTALDGKGGNSPFAAALVKHVDEDGVELGRFFRRVTSTVLAATGNQQEPFVYGRMPDEDFLFQAAQVIFCPASGCSAGGGMNWRRSPHPVLLPLGEGTVRHAPSVI